MQDRSTAATVATDNADDHVHPFWCEDTPDLFDEGPATPHDQHLSQRIYVELQDHDALATLALAQLDWRHEDGKAYDLNIRLKLKSRTLRDSAEAFMSIREAETLRDALTHRIDEATAVLRSDREHSRGWALGTGSGR